MNKKLVITADDFGISEEANEAIFKSFTEGALTSTCLMANGKAFEHAIEILKDIKEIGFGVHLNIIEEKTLLDHSKSSHLCDYEGNYNNGFIKLLLKSTDKDFLSEIETDFRLQIEKILNKTEIDHLNSHVHTHSIPNIFKITCKLAKEYNIKYVRTQNEIPYFIPEFKKHIQLRYPVNLIKLGLLNTFSQINRKTLKEFGLLSNDFFIGVSYTGYMDESTIKCGLSKITKDNSITEVLIHPTTDDLKQDNFKEFQSILNPELKNYLANSKFELTNFKKLV